MNRSGEDNRSVRNTKRKLRSGLITLLSEKPLNEISVKELTDSVDVNRGTFYFHYSDIYDMLSKIEDEVFERFDSILNDPDPDMRGSANEYLTAIFSFLGENHDLCEILLGPHGDMQFVNRVKSLIDERCSDLWRENASQSSVWKYEMKTKRLLSILFFLKLGNAHNFVNRCNALERLFDSVPVQGAHAFLNGGGSNRTRS